EVQAGDPARETLGEAVDVLRAALTGIPADSADRGVVVNNLALGLVLQFEVVREPRLLDEAESLCRAWLGRHGREHSPYLLAAGTLGRLLVARAASGGPPEVAIEAEEVLRALVDTVAEEDQVHTAALGNLALLAKVRVELGHRAANREKALALAES